MKEIDIEILWEMDLDKYVNWVLGLQEKGYKPTALILKGFPIWRKESFDQWMRTFDGWQIGNPHPQPAIADKLVKYICEKMPAAECQLLAYIDGSYFPPSRTSKHGGPHWRLARLIGKLEFLQWLHKTHISAVQRLNQSTADKARTDLVETTKDYFDSYLTSLGKSNFENIKNHFKESKPQEFAILLWAMYDLKFLTKNPLEYGNVTQLHKASVGAFGNIGTRQSLQKNIPLTENKTYNERREKIKSEIQR